MSYKNKGFSQITAVLIVLAVVIVGYFIFQSANNNGQGPVQATNPTAKTTTYGTKQPSGTAPGIIPSTATTFPSNPTFGVIQKSVKIYMPIGTAMNDSHVIYVANTHHN